jgi:lipoprotein-anchoring transpeptidase ErfK/SrfK
MNAFVDKIAEQYDQKPKKAKLKFVEDDYAMQVIPEVTGVVVSKTATASALMKLAERTVANHKEVGLLEVPYEKVTPALTAEDLAEKATLVVSLGRRRIYLYRGGDLEKTYPCAIGKPGYPTPRGDFKVVAKRYMPTWSNPGSSWASDMPATIAPGPSTPLGVRALNIDAPGIRIHGTTNIRSVGSAASHGCMRVANGLIVDLYERVEVGTPVYIRQ